MMQIGCFTSSVFLKNLMAYGASEVASKLSRLFVVVAVARALGPEQVGLAAAALGFCEIIKALTENGINQRIMAAAPSALASTCAKAHQLNWIWCIGLLIGQCLLALVLWRFGQGAIAVMVAIAALEYVFMPAGLVQAALAMREGKLNQTAAVAGAQIVGANILAVLMALLIPSPLVLILPRVLTAPFWLIAMRRLRPWARDPSVPKAGLRPFLTYGRPVLGIELVKALRLHADKLIVGALLGAEDLGVYFMAFNAGLSLATSYVAAFEKVVFPHLCAQSRAAPSQDHQGLRMTLLGLAVVAPFVALQSLFAPTYVPWLLGNEWGDVVPVVSVLCLCALPLTIWTVRAAQLRLAGRADTEFRITLLLTACLMAGAAICAPFGLMTMAITYFLTVSVILIAASMALPSRTFPLTAKEVS